MNDLENLTLLFSDNEKDIYKALLDKKDWINTKLILEGNLDYYIDENNIRRFPFLENLFDNVVKFNFVYYQNNDLSEEKNKHINKHLREFKRCVFKTKIILNDNAPFYVEYDFNKLDALGYKSLVANFYNMHKEKDLNINFNNDEINSIDLIKICMIGSDFDKCIILSNDSLINDVYFLPIVSKIYIAKPIEEDLYKELEIYCKDNDVIMEAIYEHI